MSLSPPDPQMDPPSLADIEVLARHALAIIPGRLKCHLADIILRMLKKGLIRRRRTKRDARVYAVKLTDAGFDALRAAQPAAYQADTRLLSALPETKRADFLESLSAIVGAMTATNSEEPA